MSSPCRTTSLLVSKESDGRISYKSRENEDSLSLKMGEQTFCISFSFLPLHVFLSFVLFLLFLLFFLFLFLLSHFPFIFSSFSLLLCHSLPFWMSIDRMGQKEAISSSFPQVSCVAINFPSLFFISLFPFYDIINHMAQYGPWNCFSHTWLIVSHSFLCQVSHF